MRALSVGATGMMAQQLNVETISNNIANMTTTGYKRRRAEFQDLLYQSERRTGSATSDETRAPTGIQLGLGVKTAAVYPVTDQGELTNTENKLDVAIQGSGFFVVDKPDGEQAYTRSGNFQLSQDGNIVTPDGFELSPAIQVPVDATEVSINASGQVSAKISGQTNLQVLGQLELATFVNPAGLEASGSNLWMETEASGAPTLSTPGTEGAGTVLQGYLESSNVNPVQELTSLIMAQRAYDMNSKVITASDQMMSTITQMR
ncbi:flagellar basal-body rod protein FlgG [Arboricoccus pini]|uniref:Flagellar basal-body rod protein FlgG n=1 Tax=Arboricoccus pini TaxID=1963835 RepID=A0A212RSF4_9PROT|nr:flagellar basal-body rod protein FlgG [Arboricoccus pini]SNB75519.1 flagellar basal-body rod protein FlgG [Arboricoccus pini]